MSTEADIGLCGLATPATPSPSSGRWPWLHSLIWLLLLLGLWSAFPRRIGTVLLRETTRTNAVHLPWFGHKQPGVFRFEVELLAPVANLSLRADDCVDPRRAAP